MTAAGPSLEIAALTVAYDNVVAVRDLSLSVAPGEVVGLIGPNGAGKSTTLHAIMGVVRPKSGDIRLGGRSIVGRRPEDVARSGVALVPEGRRIFADLTVEENLKVLFRQKLGRKQVPDALERAYGSFPILGSRRKQQGGTLSGGEQRILSLAKVLVAAPGLVIADEISLGLAPIIMDAIYDGLRRVNAAGTALLIVEQQVDRVLDIAATAIVLEHGSVAYDGPAENALSAVQAVLASRGERSVAGVKGSGRTGGPVPAGGRAEGRRPDGTDGGPA